MSVVAAWAEDELARLSRLGLRRTLEPLATAQGARVRIGGEELVNLSSNDYLGLAGEPRVAEAAREALSRWGMGTGASRLVVGDSLAHRSLEEAISKAFGVGGVTLFNSGYAANVGIVQSLVGDGDAVFSDALNHASLIDGCRLSRAKTHVYPHCDAGALDALLARTVARRKLVVTDAIFSMDGDSAPIRDLVEVCERHGAGLVVDEAHAAGVVGPRGQGLCASLGLEGRVDVRMATLGKAFGSYGAFALTSPAVAELLVNRARSFVFSTSLPPAVCAAGEAGVRIAESDEARRARIWRNIERFATGLQRLGVDAQPRSPIFPVVLGTPERALDAARTLRAKGLLVKPIRPPTVPEGTSRLRFSLSAAHGDHDIDLALDALKSLEIPHVA